MIIENKIKKLNLFINKNNEKERLNFYKYYNFTKVEDILNYFDLFAINIEKQLSIYLDKEKSLLMISLKNYFKNDIENISFLITSIVFKNLLKNNLMNYDKKEEYVEPFLINSDVFLDKCLKDIKGFIIYYDIDIKLEDFRILDKEVRGFFFRIISFLETIKENYIIVKRKEIYYKNKLKTPVFYGLEKKIWFLDYLEYCEIYLEKLRIKKFKKISYLIGENFSKCNIIFKENPRSSSYFILKDNKTLNKLLNQKVYIDYENLNSIISKIELETNLKWDEIENNIKNMYIRISNEKIVESEKKEIMRSISKKINLFNIIILRILDLKKEQHFYFRFSFDFRGRIYYESKVGITYSKLNRFTYFFGFKNKKNYKMIEIDLLMKRINENKYILESILDIYNIEKNLINLNLLYWISISIGKNFIIKSDKGIKDSLFIEKCLNYIKNKKDFKTNLELSIELDYLECMIKNLKNDIIKISPISKDATASVIQNYMRILGPKDDNSMKISNIDGGFYWYDPYSFIIEKFIEKNEKNEIIEKYFKRKYLKKIIMTIPYQSTYNTCQNYFIEEIWKDYKDFDKNDFFKKDHEKKKETSSIIIYLKKFYFFLKNEIEDKYLYEKSSNEILNIVNIMLEKDVNIKNDFKIYLEINENIKNINVYDYKNSKTNLVYYKMTTKYMDFFIKIEKDNKIRKTKEYKKIEIGEIDLSKIITSFKANYVHFYDAEFLRMIIDKMEKEDMMFIHDCVLIGILDINKLIMICNKIFFNKKIKEFCIKTKKKPFSLFILL